jgi:AraC family L-rhamnose operon transcriptional activator RhaR
MVKYMVDADMPMETQRGPLRFAGGALAYAGLHLHVDGHPMHTHRFVEVAFVVDGSGTHDTLAGRRRLAPGDVVLLRPGVWHAYKDCQRLVLYNFCFGSELLHHELAWTHEDPLLRYLLWNGPYAASRRGVLSFHLAADAYDRCYARLEALDALRNCPLDRYRSDVLGLLCSLLGELGRAAAPPGQPDGSSRARPHPAVRHAMRLLESDIARPWTLADLAGELHLAPAYLVRLFKEATGLPPKAYLAQLRAERAAVLLLNSDDPVTSVGRAVGWPDQNYFARRFKAHYGLNATTYRKRFAAKAPGIQLGDLGDCDSAYPRPGRLSQADTVTPGQRRRRRTPTGRGHPPDRSGAGRLRRGAGRAYLSAWAGPRRGRGPGPGRCPGPLPPPGRR